MVMQRWREKYFSSAQRIFVSLQFAIMRTHADKKTYFYTATAACHTDYGADDTYYPIQGSHGSLF